jgi:hypothetical protein
VPALILLDAGAGLRVPAAERKIQEG